MNDNIATLDVIYAIEDLYSKLAEGSITAREQRNMTIDVLSTIVKDVVDIDIVPNIVLEDIDASDLSIITQESLFEAPYRLFEKIIAFIKDLFDKIYKFFTNTSKLENKKAHKSAEKIKKNKKNKGKRISEKTDKGYKISDTGVVVSNEDVDKFRNTVIDVLVARDVYGRDFVSFTNTTYKNYAEFMIDINYGLFGAAARVISPAIYIERIIEKVGEIYRTSSNPLIDIAKALDEYYDTAYAEYIDALDGVYNKCIVPIASRLDADGQYVLGIRPYLNRLDFYYTNTVRRDLTGKLLPELTNSKFEDNWTRYLYKASSYGIESSEKLEKVTPEPNIISPRVSSIFKKNGMKSLENHDDVRKKYESMSIESLIIEIRKVFPDTVDTYSELVKKFAELFKRNDTQSGKKIKEEEIARRSEHLLNVVKKAESRISEVLDDGNPDKAALRANLHRLLMDMVNDSVKYAQFRGIDVVNTVKHLSDDPRKYVLTISNNIFQSPLFVIDV